MKNVQKDPPPQDLVSAALEAVIFAAGEPISLRELSEALGGLDSDAVEQAVDELAERYRAIGNGLQVERVAGGFRLATRPEVGAWVRRFFRQRNRTRLSQASLETLAIVAYRQPITAPEIQAIRGVDSSASLKSLFERKLIRILGKKKVVGSPLLYGTSKQFLVHFGLDRLQDLPPADSFGDLLGAGPEEANLISPPVAEQLHDADVSAIEESDDEESDAGLEEE